MSRSFPGGFQTTMVEYLVTGSLDGVTPAPDLGPLLENKSGPAQPYRFEVENLGLIDLSFDLPNEAKLDPVTIGWRYIPWMHVSLSGPGILLLDNGAETGTFLTPGDVSSFRQTQLLDDIGSTLTYSRKGYCIPQGQTFRLNGIGAAPGSQILVRFGVLIPRSEEEEQAIREAFCCTARIPTGTTPFDPCPECDCPFGPVEYTDVLGNPLAFPIDLPQSGVSEVIRVSGDAVYVGTVLSAGVPFGQIGDVSVVNATFNSEGCYWQYQLQDNVGLDTGVEVFMQLRNLCFDTCASIIDPFAEITAP